MKSTHPAATGSPGPRLRSALLGMLVIAAFGIAPAAASAASTLSLEVPSSAKARQDFTVKASGTAERDAFVYLYLEPDTTPCGANPSEEQSRGAPSASAQRVEAGQYSITGQISALAGSYTVCGYLSTNSSGTPDAKATAGPVTVVGDTDGDGVFDDTDKCPNEHGTDERTGQTTADGCPIRDADRDGIRNEEDRCPDQRGVDERNGQATADGCPIRDTDRDGVRNEEDKCPSAGGQGTADGCPAPPTGGTAPGGTAPGGTAPDTDGDGIADAKDQCPLEDAETVLKKDPARPGCLESGFVIDFGEMFDTFTGRKKANSPAGRRFDVRTTGFLRTKSFEVTVTLSEASRKKAKLAKRLIASTKGDIPNNGKNDFVDSFKKPKPTAAIYKKLKKLKKVSVKYRYTIKLVNGETRKKTESYTLTQNKGGVPYTGHVVFGPGTSTANAPR